MRFKPEVEPEVALEIARAFFMENAPLITQPVWDNPVVAFASEHAYAGSRRLFDALEPEEAMVVCIHQMMSDVVDLVPQMEAVRGADRASILLTLNALATLPQVVLHYLGSAVTLEDMEAMGLTFEGEE